MKNLKLYFQKFSVWVDEHLGFYLTNPANRWRWEQRKKERDLNI